MEHKYIQISADEPPSDIDKSLAAVPVPGAVIAPAITNAIAPIVPAPAAAGAPATPTASKTSTRKAPFPSSTWAQAAVVYACLLALYTAQFVCMVLTLNGLQLTGADGVTFA